MNGFSDRFRAALSAYQRGDLQSARAAAETLLQLSPNNPDVMSLAGVVLCEAGQTDRGIALLRKLISDHGDTTDRRINLVKALADAGQLDKAEALCSDAFAEQSPDLQRIKAQILRSRGHHGEAAWAYERMVEARPDDFEGWNNLGNARHQAGDLEGALTALQQAATLAPDSALVRINLGRLLVSMDRHEDACLIFEQAVLRDPKDPAPLLDLGKTLISIDRPQAGLRALGDAAKLDPRNPRAFVAMATAFSDLGDLRKAEQAARIAIQVDPAFAPAYLNLGILLEKENRVAELDALISQADVAGASGGDVEYLRALSLARAGATENALTIVRSVDTPSVNPTIVARFKGQLADKLNKIDEAFGAFEEMNFASANSPIGLGIDREAYQRAIADVAARTTPEWFASWPPVPAETQPADPVFLIGFPRSGTTLLDTILMGHSRTHVLEEVPILETLSNEIGSFVRLSELDASQVAALRARYFSELNRISPPKPGMLVIDKNPLSMLRIPLIHRLFPNAKIILAMRHPCDVVLSCYMQNFKVTEAMASFLDLSNASRTYDQIFSYWEKCRAIFPLDVHILRYEAMVEDVEATVRPLIDFLGLPWEDRVLDHQHTAKARGYIRTPSYAQVTERIYSSASGRWTRYRDHMSFALPVLEPWVRRYGYAMN